MAKSLPNITNAFPIRPHNPIIPKNTGTTIETIRSSGHSPVSLSIASSHSCMIVAFAMSLHCKCILLVSCLCMPLRPAASVLQHKKLNWRATRFSMELFCTQIWGIESYFSRIAHHKFSPLPEGKPFHVDAKKTRDCFSVIKYSSMPLCPRLVMALLCRMQSLRFRRAGAGV